MFFIYISTTCAVIWAFCYFIPIFFLQGKKKDVLFAWADCKKGDRLISIDETGK